MASRGGASVAASSQNSASMTSKSMAKDITKNLNKNASVKANINENLNVDQLREKVKMDNAEKVWNKIFKPDAKLGKLGILYQWKAKYLFPYGDIAPLRDFETDMSSKQPHAKTKSARQGASTRPQDEFEQELQQRLPVEMRNFLDSQPHRTFEKLINEKYRLSVEDMGGLQYCAHWVEELKQPILISQDQVSKDLHRFSNAFPIEFIPFKTDAEITIENLQKRIKRIQIKKMNALKNNE